MDFFNLIFILIENDVDLNLFYKTLLSFKEGQDFDF